MERATLNISFMFLDVVGLHPTKFEETRFVKAFVCLLVKSIACLLMLMEMLLNYEGPETVVKLMAPFSGAFQSIFKGFIIFSKRNDFLKLIKLTEAFWPIDKYGNEIERKFEKIYLKFTKLFKIFSVSCGLTFILYVLKPSMTRRRELPIQWYNIAGLDSAMYYISAYIYQISVVAIMFFSLWGFDGFLYSVFLLVYCEMEKIKFGYENAGYSNNGIVELKILIEQQKLILSIIDKINQMFSLVLVNQIGTSLGTICASIYFLMEDGKGDFGAIVLYVPFMLCVTLQIYCFCFAGNIIVEQAESIGDAAYNSDWYNSSDLELRRLLVFVIHRAQRSIRIRAGDIWALDMETFLSVLQKAFSLFTFMKTFNN